MFSERLDAVNDHRAMIDWCAVTVTQLTGVINKVCRLQGLMGTATHCTTGTCPGKSMVVVSRKVSSCLFRPTRTVTSEIRWSALNLEFNSKHC